MMLPIRSHNHIVLVTIVLAIFNSHCSRYVVTAQRPMAHGPRCSEQSIILARQMLTHELEMMNDYIPLWFNDLDKDELIEKQKQSLSNIAMSGSSRRLLNSNGLPLFEIDSSYFRPVVHANWPIALSGHGQQNLSSEQNPLMMGGPTNVRRNISGAPNSIGPNVNNRHINVRLLGRQNDKRCHLKQPENYYEFAIALALGPFEHHLDVVYNLPKDLRLSQPIDWRYAQVTILVPQMNYEILLKQSIDLSDQSEQNGGTHNNSSSSHLNETATPRQRDKRIIVTKNALPFACPPIEIKEFTYVPQQAEQLSISSQGLALNNQTQLQIERLFSDYTRPSISQRLKQMLKFHLSTKTLPLSIEVL